jgi:hypothetical protein
VLRRADPLIRQRPLSPTHLCGKEASMCRPGSIVVALAICCAAFSFECAVAVAQEGARPAAPRSTIRLCTATEQARETSLAQPVPQERAPVTDQDMPPEPVNQAAEMQPVERTAPSNGGDAANAPVSSAPAPATPAAAPRQRMPAGFYPSDSVRAALNQAPGRVPIQSAPRLQTRRPGGKPFQSIPTQPSISPYLYLNSGGTNTNLVTNYFGFVRPQLDQIEANRQQQREIQQLKSQMKKMSTAGAGQQAADSRSAAHYMDTGQFYRGLQRQ